jgi:hypothetical protein
MAQMTTDVEIIMKSMSEQLGLSKVAGEEVPIESLISRIENDEFTDIKGWLMVTKTQGEFIPLRKEQVLQILKSGDYSGGIYIETDGSSLRFGG